MSENTKHKLPVKKLGKKSEVPKGTDTKNDNKKINTKFVASNSSTSKKLMRKVSEQKQIAERFPFNLYITRPLVTNGPVNKQKSQNEDIEIPKFMLKKKLSILPKAFKQNNWDISNQNNLKQLESDKKTGNQTTQGLYDQLKVKRDEERKKLEQLKLVDKADTSKNLTDAIEFQGSCLEMCPIFERVRRELENNVSNLEKQSGFISPEKAIKAFARPAASAPPPLPSDVRPPHILVKTLNYIIDNLLQTLPENESFIWDRTRSIRQDFTLQNYFGPECVDCCEKIVRIHLLTLHVMIKNNTEFSKQQELEQLNKSIITLCEIYDEGRKRGIKYPNEAEIRSYWCLLNPRDPELDNQIQMLPREIFQNKHFQLSLTFRRTMSNSFFKERGHKAVNNGLNLTSTFFNLIEMDDTPFLLGCFLETFVSEIRFHGLLKLKQTWSKKVTKALSFDTIIDSFKFNSDIEVLEICDYYSIAMDKQMRTMDLTTLIHDNHLLPEKSSLRDCYLRAVETKLSLYGNYSNVINSGQKISLKIFQNVLKTPNKVNLTKKKSNIKSSASDNQIAKGLPKVEFGTKINKQLTPSAGNNEMSNEISGETPSLKNVASKSSLKTESSKPFFNLRRANEKSFESSENQKAEEKKSSFEAEKQELKFDANMNSGDNNLKFSFGSNSSVAANFNQVESQIPKTIFGNKQSNTGDDLTRNITSTKKISNFTNAVPITKERDDLSLSKSLGVFESPAVTSLKHKSKFASSSIQTPDRPFKPTSNPDIPKKQHSDSPIADAALIKKNTYKIIYKDILSETSDLLLDQILLNRLLRNIASDTKADMNYETILKKQALNKMVETFENQKLEGQRKSQMEISIQATKDLISDRKKRQISLHDFLQNQSNLNETNLLNFTPVKNEKRQLKITKELLKENENTHIVKHYLNHINYNMKINNNFNKFEKVDLNWLVYTDNWKDISIKTILKIIGFNQIPFATKQDNINLRVSRYKPGLILNQTQLLIFNTGVTSNDIFDIDGYMKKEFTKLKQILNSMATSNNYKIDILILYWSNDHSAIFDLKSLREITVVNSVEIVTINNSLFPSDLKVAMNAISTRFRFNLNGQLGEKFLQAKLKELLKSKIVGRSPMLNISNLDSINEKLSLANKEFLEEKDEHDLSVDQYFFFDQNNKKRKLAVVNSARKKQKSENGGKKYNFMTQNTNNSSNSTFESPPPNFVTSKKGIPTLVFDNTSNQRKSTFNHKNKRLITPINSSFVEEQLSDEKIVTPSNSAFGSILNFIKTPIRKIKN